MKSFNLVKFAFTTTPVLFSPDYTHDFIIFSFASEDTMATSLMKKRDQVEQPIAFFSRIIQDATLRYNIIEKQDIALIKALKDFRVYIMHSHTIAYVPNATVKDFLMQTNLEGRRGKWIVAMLEYDLEIKPTKLIKFHALDINLITAMSNDEDDGSLIQVSKMFLKSPWYSDIVYVLQHLSPLPRMSKSKGRSLKLKFVKFHILNSALYWKDPRGDLLNCLVVDEAQVSNKKSIGMSPFELVYGTDIVFPTSLAVSIMRLLQEAGSEEDDIQRRINQMIHLHQTGEEVSQNTFWLQEKIKKIYDHKTKVEKFHLEDVVLRWDA
eukprot:PITA_34250